MRFENYRCECGHVIEDYEIEYGEETPYKVDCPECGLKESCKIDWSTRTEGGIKIPNNFQALPRSQGAKDFGNRMKNYKGQNGKKRLY